MDKNQVFKVAFFSFRGSVADPDVYSGSRIRIFSHPRFNKNKKWSSISQNCKLFIFSNRYRKRFESIDTNLSIFTQNDIKLSELWVGPGIRKKFILDPGSRGKKRGKNRIWICNTVQKLCIFSFERRGKNEDLFYIYPVSFLTKVSQRTQFMSSCF